jgi:hypothetical protein
VENSREKKKKGKTVGEQTGLVFPYRPEDQDLPSLPPRLNGSIPAAEAARSEQTQLALHGRRPW